MTGVRRSRVACLAAALSVVVSFGSGSPAQAGAPVTDGFLCIFEHLPDADAPDGTRLVEVSGGPVLLTESDGVTPARGTLICRIATTPYPWPGFPDHTGGGTDVAGRGTGVLTAGPEVVRLPGEGEWWDFSLCMRFVNDRDGVTYYWDEDWHEWSTSPAVHCRLYQEEHVGPTTEDLLDSIVCPILTILFPPEGDIPGIWDCPPYGNNGPLPTVGPTPTITPPPVTPPPVVLLGCDDGLDNDADGLADYPADPGCASPADTDEHSFAPCDDGADNDGDRAADYPRDPGCASAADLDERGTTACDDGLDNDGDGARDYLLDPGCSSPADTDEESFP